MWMLTTGLTNDRTVSATCSKGLLPRVYVGEELRLRSQEPDSSNQSYLLDDEAEGGWREEG
jgi:hypothetical protein